MLCTRNTKMSKLLKLSTELSGKLNKKHKNSSNLRELQAYADGLEIPLDDVLYTFLLPEIVSSFNKWVPNLLGLIPGCSSLFMKDSNNELIHTRILDYALSGPFEKNERSILYDFKDRNKVFSYSSSGMPFPAMTAMNEQGLTLALHYKHGQYFDLEGESIFFLTNEILNSCSNIREAIKLIKQRRSISYWGLYLSDSNGEVASVDIRGEEIYQEKFDIKDHEYLYFNNRPLLRQNDQSSIQPFGNINLCQMKRKSLEKDIKNFQFDPKKNSLIQSMKLVGSLSSKKSKTALNWNISPITPSSIQFIAFNNNNFSSLMTSGHGPKHFSKQKFLYKNIFSNLQMENVKQNNKETDYQKAYTLLANFQSHIDKGEITQAYHQIQMAKKYFQGYSEEYIVDFYYSVLQYIYESDNRDLTYLFHNFEDLAGKLPEYLEDHRKLFIMRLAKIIGHKANNESSQINNEHLQSIYREEFKLNGLSIKGLRYLIFPRIEILDIIYAY